jgi:hypothetical protein
MRVSETVTNATINAEKPKKTKLLLCLLNVLSAATMAAYAPAAGEASSLNIISKPIVLRAACPVQKIEECVGDEKYDYVSNTCCQQGSNGMDQVAFP